MVIPPLVGPFSGFTPCSIVTGVLLVVGIGSVGAVWAGAGLARSLSCSCAGVGGMCSGEGGLGETGGVTYSGD